MFVLNEQPTPNFTMKMGDGPANILWELNVKKTLRNRLKYWLFCQFFPFRIVRWDK